MIRASSRAATLPTSVFLTDADWLSYASRGVEAEFLGLWRAWRNKLGVTDLRFIDLFCGAGGEAQGLVKAGLRPVLAANHWEWAIRSHQENHPDTDHFQGDLHQGGIVEALPYAEIFWASPACPAWSQGTGEARTFDKPPSLMSLEEFSEEERELYGEGTNEERERSRALMWDVPRYLEAMLRREGRPVLAGVVENVVEARTWYRWNEWRDAFRQFGYRTRLIAFNSMHADAPRSLRAPQSRDRLFFAFWHRSLRRDPDFDKWLRPRARCAQHGEIVAVQSWKKPGQDVGRYRSQYVYRCPQVSCRNAIVEPDVEPASLAIDFTLPTQRIAERKRPLKPKTRTRIAAGLRKYQRAAFLATTAGHTFERQPGVRTRPITVPMPTVHTTASESLVVPPLLVPAEGRDGKEAAPVTVPMRTQIMRNETALVIPPLVVTLRRHGQARPAHIDPLQTFSAAGFHHALVMRNNSSKGDGGEMCTPVGESLRTLTTAGHQAIVEWEDVEVDVDDCALRMLEPAEIGLGMAFGPDYVVLGNKRVMAREYGNAVTPPVAELLGLALREAITGEELEPGRPSGSHAARTSAGVAS